MIKPEQVPNEVMNAFNAALLHGESYYEAIAAAINAWPGSTGEWNVLDDRMWITLPVQQEAGDE